MSFAAQLLLAATLLTSVSVYGSQADESTSGTTPAEISFEFDRVGVAVPHFVLQVREDGAGRYQAEQAAQSSSSPSLRPAGAQQIDRTLVVSRATTAKIFAAAHAANRFNIACASKAKNIADTGTKRITYSGPDGSGSCVYNYTEEKPVSLLNEIFLAIASTLDEGRKLDYLHRYDRLGLDAEMDFFTQQTANGHAIELGAIAPTLFAIVNDPDLIQRVRLRASRLLEEARATP